MSDSDETIWEDKNELENSPSILSRWHEIRETDGNDVVNDGHKQRESTDSSSAHRGLKRKENFEEVSSEARNELEYSDEQKNVNNEDLIKRKQKSPFTTKIHDATATDEMMLENLLKDVEQLVTKKEFEVDQGQACNPEEVEAANIQLIKIQKCLTEKHFKNQSNRKVILSDATDSQTLSMEKRKAVVDLARKQRNLLEVFKKYKSLSERVRSISSKKIGPCTLSNTRRKTLFHANVQNDITLTCTPSSESNQFHLSEDANSSIFKLNVLHDSEKSQKENSTGCESDQKASQLSNKNFVFSKTQQRPKTNTSSVMNATLLTKNGHQLNATEFHLTSTTPALMHTNTIQKTPKNCKSLQFYEKTSLRKQIPELSLEALVGRGILKAGKNVLSTASEGRLYSASLSDNGRIISTGGEGFKSPRSWIKAICGSKRKVKNDVAWKMVLYKNKPLLEYALTTVAPETFETATTAQATSSTENNRRKSCKEVITTAEGLKSLLKNCRVTGIDKNEILSVPVEMQGDFWDNDEFELMNVDVLNDRQIKD